MAGRHKIAAEASSGFLSWPNGRKEVQFLAVGIVGVSEGVELAVEIPYLIHDRHGERAISGIRDLQMVAKLSLLPASTALPALGLRGAVKTDTADSPDHVGSGGTDYQLVMAASKPLGPLQVDGMGGLALSEEGGGERKPAFPYGLAGDWGVGAGLHLVAEVAGQRHADRTAEKDPAVFSAGLILPINSRLIADAGAGLGLTEAAPEMTATLGLTISF